MDLTGNTILVTGGTSGIGRALAERFHALGNQVIISGRRQALLEEVTARHPGMRGIAVDMDDAAALARFAARVRDEFPRLNVLVNNAGVLRTEDYTADEVDVGGALAMVQTNIVSVLQLTAALLPLLRQQPKATLMATSSGLAFVPRAIWPTYCASKAFIHSWLQSLRFQLRASSVEVLELAPPYVQTEVSGAQQLTDPRAMPLADYVQEVMQLLAEPNPPQGEILVQRVQPLRWAERAGEYEARYAALNAL